jgi:N-acetyl-anhydromuramyl-L-alanine amidase AmpD
MPKFHDRLIPVEPGQAVDAGWPEATGSRPHGVTWHWTATRTREECDRLLGGPNAERRGVASAHYAIGRSFEEGISRYVALENRSWHAGKNQLLRWDGSAFGGDEDKGSRTTVGVETVNIGYAREGVPAGPDWTVADSADGRTRMKIAPWTAEQVEMMVLVGKEIVASWPEIGPRDHHGHHDLCPTWKVDPAGFPFAAVLRGIYDDPNLPDVWTPTWKVGGRREWLRRLGYADHFVMDEDLWWQSDDLALRRFQRDEGLPANGFFTTFVAWRIFDWFKKSGEPAGVFL